MNSLRMAVGISFIGFTRLARVLVKRSRVEPIQPPVPIIRESHDWLLQRHTGRGLQSETALLKTRQSPEKEDWREREILRCICYFRNLAKLSLVVLLFCLFNETVCGSGLKGTYTIDPSGAGVKNFISFAVAVQQLKDSGVAGPVTFEVADGRYSEIFTIPAVKGSSLKNMIVFQAKSLDSSKVIIDSFAATVPIIQITCSYCIIRKMTIRNDADGVAIHIYNNADYNTIEDCIIQSTDGSCIDDLWNSTDQHNTIRNNHIAGGGTYGIDFESCGVSCSKEEGNIIDHNFIDSCQIAIYGIHQDSLIITNNTIHGCIFIENYVGGPITANCLISNNFIVSDTFGILISDGNKMRIYNNTVVSGNAGQACVYLTNPDFSTATYLKDNIFFNTSSGIVINDDNGTGVSDYNDLYTSGKVLGNWEGSNYSNIGNWQKATGQDKHSISADPKLNSVSTYDLHLTNLSPISLDSGIYIAPDSLDIDGDKRNKVHTWMGADEYVADTLDAGVTSILYPLNNSCGDSNMSVRIKVHNFGVRTVSNFKIGVYVNGASNDSANFYYSDSLQSGKDTILSVAFSNPWNTSPGGFYKIRAFTILHGDQFPGNDSTEVNIKINTVPKTPSVLLKGNDTLVASYTGDSCQWYLDSVVVSNGKCEYVATKSGKYQVMVYDSSCPSPMSAVYNFTFVGIEGQSKDEVISIYPNPANTKLYLTQHPPTPFKGGLTQARATITDLSGRTLLMQSIIADETVIDVSTLPSGIYLLRYQDNERVQVLKFSKE